MVGILPASVPPPPGRETLHSGPEAVLLPDASAFDLLITWLSLGLSRERERLQGREEGTIITSAVVLAARLKPLWFEFGKKRKRGTFLGRFLVFIMNSNMISWVRGQGDEVKSKLIKHVSTCYIKKTTFPHFAHIPILGGDDASDFPKKAANLSPIHITFSGNPCLFIVRLLAQRST